ncbi:MAG: hypothetical protein QXR02_02130 [Acidilobaceae archaeon]
MYIGVNFTRAREVGRLLSRIASNLEVDMFLDTDYYPSASASRRTITAYFLVMVAMDHRLSRPGKPYEAVIDGKVYHGADLLYRLGSMRLNDDPGFFEAERLAKVTTRDIIDWLTLNGKLNVKPPDPDIRAELLRDIGLKLYKLFDGDPYNIIIESRGRLRDSTGGFLNIIKVFKAYQDPVEKKALLLAKFLERRRVLEITDQYNKEVPVDNHLVRIALRTGIVEVDDETIEAIAAGVEFEEERDIILRFTTRRAYKEVSIASVLDPFILDDILWSFGRRCCTRDKPTCRDSCRAECIKLRGCNGGCILSPICRAFREPKYMVPEHNFITFWY